MSGRVVLFVSCVALAYGCDAAGPSLLPCDSDRDCPRDRPHCAGVAVASQPIILPECSPECFSAADCPTGFICAAREDTRGLTCAECVEGCQTAGCAEGFVCTDTGECRLMLCDEAGAPACPDGWRCDPAAATTNATGTHADPNDSTRMARGCARNPCGEENGVYCADLWRCDPPHSPYSSGCVALPCADTGHCSNDATLVCTPTNAGPRMSGSDAHGCVYRNCGEGALLCSIDQVCDAGACRFRTCAERECPPGSHCEETPGGISSCTLPPSSTGGTTGAGGASSTGGTTSGGTSPAAGGTGALRGAGHCE